MKALRHEAPGVAETAARLGIDRDGRAARRMCMKTLHTAHAGKLSLARVLRGTFPDGATATAPGGETARIAGSCRLMGADRRRRSPSAAAGRHGRARQARPARDRRRRSRSASRLRRSRRWRRPSPSWRSPCARATARTTSSCRPQSSKLLDEDRSLSVEQNAELGEMVLRGQGEMHLRVAVERLQSKFGVGVDAYPPQIGYRETIRKTMTGVRGRHKKQSGGHGQFGDVVVDVAPAAARRRASPSPTRSPAASCRGSTSPRSRRACSDF